MKEILTELIEAVKKRGGEGICFCSATIPLNNKDYRKLVKWLKVNLPEPKYSDPDDKSHTNYSWPYGKVKPRVKWLETQIKNMEFFEQVP